MDNSRVNNYSLDDLMVDLMQTQWGTRGYSTFASFLTLMFIGGSMFTLLMISLVWMLITYMDKKRAKPNLEQLGTYKVDPEANVKEEPPTKALVCRKVMCDEEKIDTKVNKVLPPTPPSKILVNIEDLEQIRSNLKSSKPYVCRLNKKTASSSNEPNLLIDVKDIPTLRMNIEENAVCRIPPKIPTPPPMPSTSYVP